MHYFVIKTCLVQSKVHSNLQEIRRSRRLKKKKKKKKKRKGQIGWLIEDRGLCGNAVRCVVVESVGDRRLDGNDKITGGRWKKSGARGTSAYCEARAATTDAA